MSSLLTVKGLSTAFLADRGWMNAVEDVSFQVDSGKTLCLVGESGCGKSATALSIMGLLPAGNGKITAGHIFYSGQDLVHFSNRKMREIRGREIAMIFQEPMTSLNPVFTIGNQVREAIALHEDLSRSEIRNRTVELLKQVGLSSPEKRVDDYPHQLSGGMRQRVMIAMALSCNPKILIADEPTTALDVTVQAQILSLLKELQQKLDMTMILITHDLGVVAEMAHDVAVMYAGQIVESGPVREIFKNPSHPYTRGLLQSVPRLSDLNSPARKSTRLQAIPGIVPSLHELPQGCRFQDRCSYVGFDCKQSMPALNVRSKKSEHSVRCLRELKEWTP